MDVSIGSANTGASSSTSAPVSNGSKDGSDKQYTLQRHGFTTELTNCDVLLGRGYAPTLHEGNVRFRNHVALRKDEYVKSKNRNNKSKIAREVAGWVFSNKGRFIKKLELEEAHEVGLISPEDYNRIAECVQCGSSDFVIPSYYELADDETIMDKAKQSLRQMEKAPKSSARGKNSPDEETKDAVDTILSSTASKSALESIRRESSRSSAPASALLGEPQASPKPPLSGYTFVEGDDFQQQNQRLTDDATDFQRIMAAAPWSTVSDVRDSFGPGLDAPDSAITSSSGKPMSNAALQAHISSVSQSNEINQEVSQLNDILSYDQEARSLKLNEEQLFSRHQQQQNNFQHVNSSRPQQMHQLSDILPNVSREEMVAYLENQYLRQHQIVPGASHPQNLNAGSHPPSRDNHNFINGSLFQPHHQRSNVAQQDDGAVLQTPLQLPLGPVYPSSSQQTSDLLHFSQLLQNQYMLQQQQQQLTPLHESLNESQDELPPPREWTNVDESYMQNHEGQKMLDPFPSGMEDKNGMTAGLNSHETFAELQHDAFLRENNIPKSSLQRMDPLMPLWENNEIMTMNDQKSRHVKHSEQEHPGRSSLIAQQSRDSSLSINDAADHSRSRIQKYQMQQRQEHRLQDHLPKLQETVPEFNEGMSSHVQCLGSDVLNQLQHHGSEAARGSETQQKLAMLYGSHRRGSMTGGIRGGINSRGGSVRRSSIASRTHSATLEDLMLYEPQRQLSSMAGSYMTGLDDLADSFSLMSTDGMSFGRAAPLRSSFLTTDTMDTIDQFGSVGDMSFATITSNIFSVSEAVENCHDSVLNMPMLGIAEQGEDVEAGDRKSGPDVTTNSKPSDTS